MLGNLIRGDSVVCGVIGALIRGIILGIYRIEADGYNVNDDEPPPCFFMHLSTETKYHHGSPRKTTHQHDWKSASLAERVYKKGAEVAMIS